MLENGPVEFKLYTLLFPRPHAANRQFVSLSHAFSSTTVHFKAMLIL